MPKGMGYPAKNLNATRVKPKQSVKSFKAVGKLNKSPLRPAPKYNTPKSFGQYIKGKK
jgi:hypothetical protein